MDDAGAIAKIDGRAAALEWRGIFAKLGRDVAVKVLLSEVANDAERLARVNREAQLLASLNHPHIAHVYGVDAGGGHALVMELVEGPTLADRIPEGPLSVRETLIVARQIARTRSPRRTSSRHAIFASDRDGPMNVYRLAVDVRAE